jgi:hypothetical protein
MRPHVLLAVFVFLAAQSASAMSPSFTLAPGSPTLTAIGAGPADILVPATVPAPGVLPPPVVGIPAAALGLVPGDVVTSLSYGTLPSNPRPGLKLYFSVDGASTGSAFAPPPANVSCEASSSEAKADVFLAQPVGPPLAHPNVLAVDGNGTAGSSCGTPAAPGLGLLEPSADDLRALSLCSTGSVFTGTSFTAPIYFTLAPGSPTLGTFSCPYSCIFQAGPGPAFVTPSVYTFPYFLGLDPADVIDAIDIGPTTLFSLAPGSPSLAACGFSAADILLSGSAGGGPGCARSLAGTGIGLAASDNLDAFAFAFDIDGDLVPDPCDNCGTTPNADQTNTDGDAFGDACDSSPGEAVDAKKIFIKGNADPAKRQVQVMSKDLDVQFSEGDDPSVSGASVQVFSDIDNFCALLDPGPNWLNTGTKWKFKDPVKKNVALFGDGKLKVKIKSGITYDVADFPVQQGTVHAQVQFGTGTRYCMQCPGNKKDDDKKFLGTDCVTTACGADYSPCHPGACGTFVSKWTPSAGPRGVAVDTSGNVYVAAFRRIEKYTNTGSLITQWGSYGSGDGQFDQISGIAVDASGNVYVTDTYIGTFPNAPRVQKFTSTGTFITKWGSFGGGDGQFYDHKGLAVDPSGNVFVADTGNYRIQKFDATGTFLTKWGSSGNGDGQFVNPVAVAVDGSGNVYVTEEGSIVTGGGRVQKFTNSGVFITSWGSVGSGYGQFDGAYGVAVDTSGNVYVIDRNNHRVERFDSTGKLIAMWGRLSLNFFGVDGWFQTPTGIAVDTSGNVFVTDIIRVQKFSCPLGSTSTSTSVTSTSSTTSTSGPPTTSTTSTSSTSSTSSSSTSSTSSSSTTSTSSTTTSTVSHCGTYFSGGGSGDGQLNTPEGIAADGNGFVYVADRFNHRVQKFTDAGAFVAKWGTNGTGDGQFNQPVGITVDGSGNVYVADNGNDRIQKFTDTGTFLAKWGSTGSSDGQLTAPAGLTSDGAGNIYVAEEGSNNRVQEFTDTGVFVTKWGSTGSGDGQFQRPHAVAVDASGDVYVVDANNSRMQKFTSAGAFLTKWGSAGGGNGQFSDPSFVDVDGSGTVFVSEYAGQRIQSFNSTGTFLDTWNVGGFWHPTGVAADVNGNLFVSDNGNQRIWKFACP